MPSLGLAVEAFIEASFLPWVERQANETHGPVEHVEPIRAADVSIVDFHVVKELAMLAPARQLVDDERVYQIDVIGGRRRDTAVPHAGPSAQIPLHDKSVSHVRAHDVADIALKKNDAKAWGPRLQRRKDVKERCLLEPTAKTRQQPTLKVAHETSVATTAEPRH